MCEDLLFTYRYLKNIKKIKIIEDSLINYRKRKSSALSKKIKNIDPNSLFKTYKFIMQDTKNNNVKIKSEALLLKSYYKYKNNIRVDDENYELIKNIIKDDYKKISSHDKKIIIMYKYIPIARSIIYRVRDIFYKKYS